MTSKKLKKINLGDLTLFNNDCYDVLKNLEDSSIDLILTDPPYFRVKSNGWDNQWKTEVEFLAWLDDIFAEFWRILKPNGSLYCFCGSKLSSETELLIKQRFNVLNHIVWSKPNGPWLRQHKESLRSFFPASERIIFAEHYNAEGLYKGKTEYSTKCNELKQNVFSPLIEYFKSAKELLNISAGEINKATNSKMSSHWFSYSQWQLPNEKQYSDLQSLFNKVAQEKGLANNLTQNHTSLASEYSVLSETYEALSHQYDDLKIQYENLRRAFRVTKDVPYTDVWTYPPVPYYKGKHPCEKPAAMLEDMINASSRPGDVVADFFMGSGSTLKAARKLGRKGIGVEFEEETFNKTISELMD